jgi:uncharacterized protein (DUF885 family)
MFTFRHEPRRALLRVASAALLALVAASTFPRAAVAATAVDARTESERFGAFLEAAYERQMRASPSLATTRGEPGRRTTWEDLTEAGANAAAAQAREELAAARAFRPDALDARLRLQRRVFLAQQELVLQRHRWRNHLYPLNQIVGPHVDVPAVLAAQPLDSVADAEAWIARVAAVRPYFDGLVARLDAQARSGVYLPRSVYPILIGQANRVIAGAPHGADGTSPIYADFTRRLESLDLDAATRARLLARARAVLVAELEPAYRKLVATLQRHAARTPIDAGAWQLPDGAAFYAFLVRQHTTTDMTPDDVHALGLAEVERVHGEMRALMRRVGAEGDLRTFLQRMKADPRFYYADDDAGRAAYLERARALVAAMQARLPEAFLRPPPLPLEIRATEPYRAAGAPSGFYEAGTADGRRPGVVSLNVQGMQSRPTYDLEALLYHEAVPGHHLQISSILADESIPRLRKVERWWQDSAFVDGWALYAERLAKEMGFYSDPYSDFGRLAGELWRATRLVVDSGLHAKRWSRERAIAYLDENTPSPHATNEQAVDRYLAVPGQATAFTVGMKRILEERERARRELGERFDLREFHAAVLAQGYVPLWALTEAVDDWIRTKQAAGAARSTR